MPGVAVGIGDEHPHRDWAHRAGFADIPMIISTRIRHNAPIPQTVHITTGPAGPHPRGRLASLRSRHARPGTTTRHFPGKLSGHKPINASGLRGCGAVVSHNAAVYETTADLAALQELLDRSAAAAGRHMRDIITPERRLRAAEVCAQLTGMRLLALATVTADGRPLVGPVDGIFYRRLSFRVFARLGALPAHPAPAGCQRDLSSRRAPRCHRSWPGYRHRRQERARGFPRGAARGVRAALRAAVGGVPRLWPGLCPHRREPHVHLSRGAGDTGGAA